MFLVKKKFLSPSEYDEISTHFTDNNWIYTEQFSTIEFAQDDLT